MGKNAKTILDIARGWIGRKESNGTHKEIIDVYNAHKPLARGYKVKYTDSWCATFVSACAIKCGYTDIIPTECSCNQMINGFQKIGRWCEDDSHVPSPGDVIFYDWQDSGKGDNKGSSDHVGIVEKVEGSTITIIEGNKSDAVGRRKLQVNGRYIRGYGLPKYDANATNTSGAPAPSKPQSNASSALGTYMITASDLIVRSTPAGSAVGHRGLSADGKAHDKDGDGALDKGTRITVSQISVLGNDIWGKCPSGWVCLKKGNSVYAVKDDSSSASTGSSSNANSATSKALGTYEVTASDLKVRTGPGMNYRVKTYNELTTNAKAHDYDKDGCLNYGTRVTVSRFDGDWAKIPSGWVAKRYLKKV